MFSPGDVVLGLLPFFHIAGMVFTVRLGLKVEITGSACFGSFTGWYSLRLVDTVDLNGVFNDQRSLQTTLVVIPKFSLVGMLDSITRHRMQHLMHVLLLTVGKYSKILSKGWHLPWRLRYAR
jgi:hypothetical protein